MSLNPGADVTHNVGGASGRAPAELGLRLSRVGRVDPDVHTRRVDDRRDRDALTGLLDAEPGQLSERDRHPVPATDIVDPAVPPPRCLELELKQVEEVIHMEDVADLFALAAEPDVVQRASEVVAGDPECDKALVHFAHLPGTGEDAAA